MSSLLHSIYDNLVKGQKKKHFFPICSEVYILVTQINEYVYKYKYTYTMTSTLYQDKLVNKLVLVTTVHVSKFLDVHNNPMRHFRCTVQLVNRNYNLHVEQEERKKDYPNVISPNENFLHAAPKRDTKNIREIPKRGTQNMKKVTILIPEHTVDVLYSDVTLIPVHIQHS